MPEVVSTYIETNDLKRVRRIQDKLLGAYENDFSKHAPADIVTRIKMLWNSIPTQLAKENKKFIYGLVKEGAMSRLSAKMILQGNRMFEEFKGVFTEQYVLQQLKGNPENDIFYWSSDTAIAEIDFLIQTDEKIIPIEVKAEENLSAKSLKAFYNKYHSQLSIRTSMSDYRQQEWMVNVPLYMIGEHFL